MYYITIIEKIRSKILTFYWTWSALFRSSFFWGSHNHTPTICDQLWLFWANRSHFWLIQKVLSLKIKNFCHNFSDRCFHRYSYSENFCWIGMAQTNQYVSILINFVIQPFITIILLLLIFLHLLLTCLNLKFVINICASSTDVGLLNCFSKRHRWHCKSLITWGHFLHKNLINSLCFIFQ